MEPGLYIVATPIGNLSDFTRRAAEVLREADLIAAEDTRRTQQLLQAEGLRGEMIAYHEHSGPAVAERIVEAIAQGRRVALVSDAGTPTISDPGYRLVRAVQDAGLSVVPVPGACAAIAALSASGLASDRFAFEGFLPSKAGARRRRIEALAASTATLIFYESPHRVLETLQDLVDVCGPDREAALARELTKRFETLRRAPLAELLAWARSDANQSRGEIVLLLGPAPADPDDLAGLDPAVVDLLEALADELPARRAAKLVARFAGRPSRELYDLLLARRKA